MSSGEQWANNNSNSSMSGPSSLITHSNSLYIRRWYKYFIKYAHPQCNIKILTSESVIFAGGRAGINSRCTYFDLIQVSFSSLLECGIGLCLPLTFISQILLHSSFPIDSITAINSRLYLMKKNIKNIYEDWSTNLHSSSSRDLILEICEPKFLCIPEHWIHNRQPKFSEAQRGSTKSNHKSCHKIVSTV